MRSAQQSVKYSRQFLLMHTFPRQKVSLFGIAVQDDATDEDSLLIYNYKKEFTGKVLLSR